MKKIAALLASIMAAATCCLAQEADTLIETKVIAARNTGYISGSGGDILVWNMNGMKVLPKILGNADPVRMTNLLPGVQTSSELDGGIHIHGSDASHNDISLDGVPVYNAAHLLGIFSVFNPTHFSSMRFSPENSNSNRLGGSLELCLSDTLQKRIGLDISIGLMSAQGTVRTPIGEKAGLTLSARRSFLNLLYSNFLTVEGMKLNYGFADYNISFLANPGLKDKIWVNGYYGFDRGTFGEDVINSISERWGNALGSIKWIHSFSNKGNLEQTLYASGTRSNGRAEIEAAGVVLPSSLISYGYRGLFTYENWITSLDFAFYDCSPQAPEIHKLSINTSDKERQNGFEITPRLGYRFRLFSNAFVVRTSFGLPVLRGDDGNFAIRCSPEIDARLNLYQAGRIHAGYSWKHQMLFRTGITSTSLPMEFWMISGQHASPQQAHCFSLGYEKEFRGGTWVVSADLFFKKLRGQLEYRGTLLDLISTSYSLDKVLSVEGGCSNGVAIMISRRSGRLTGWVGYTYSRVSLERGPASYERPHELNVVANYTIGDFEFGGTFVAASGTPYTPVDYLYVASGLVFAKYLDHNSSRLDPYVRLDLSMNWNCFKKLRYGEGGLNLSLYNALGRRNSIGYRPYWEDGKYYYMQTRSELRFIPSLSFYYKF